MTFDSRLIGLVGLLVSVPALAGIPDSPQEVQSLAVGARAPLFSARTTEGALRTFEPGRYKKPLVVIFYRGGWCPYCNAQLSDLHLVEPKLRKSGFEIVFLSSDRPELLYSSLEATDIHYTLLSDNRLEAAKSFHVAYHVDDATYAKNAGIRGRS
jgi:peroxiredoxin